MKDRLADILGLTVNPASSGRETENDRPVRDLSAERLAGIQINPPTFGPETDAGAERSGSLMDGEAAAAFRRANAYFAVKNYGRAVNDYSRALERAPRAPEIYFNRGITHERAGQFTKAFQDYSGAVSVKPAVSRRTAAGLAAGHRAGRTRLENMKAARLGLRRCRRVSSQRLDW